MELLVILKTSFPRITSQLGGGNFSNTIKFPKFHEGTEIFVDRSSLTEISSNGVSVTHIRNTDYMNDIPETNENLWKDYTSQFSSDNLSIGSGVFNVLANSSTRDAEFSLIHDNYTSNFKFFCGKLSSYNDGPEYGIGKLSLLNNECGIEFADGVYDVSNYTVTQDPLGMSLKFTNPKLNIAQAPIYGFTSTDLSSNENRDKFVYTADAVERRLLEISSSGGETFNGGAVANPIRIGEFELDGQTPVDRSSYAVLSPTLLHIGDYKYDSDYEGTDIRPHKISLYADYNFYDCNININAGGSYGDSSQVFVKLGAYGNDTYSVYSMFSMSNGGYGGFNFSDLDKIEETYDDSGIDIIETAVYNKYCGLKAIGLKFDNETDGLGTQQRVYAFLSNDVHTYNPNPSVAIKNGTVYTVAGIEDYIKNCGFFKQAAAVEVSDPYSTYIVGYSDITSYGYVQAFTRGGDNEGIRVLGNSTYHCEKSIATIGSGSCPLSYDFYDNTGSDGNDSQQAYISVSSDSGANIVIADNKIQLPVYNQDGTLSKNGNAQEYVAIKAVKDAATGIVSLVVMQ